jgi:hypothetical protein
VVANHLLLGRAVFDRRGTMITATVVATVTVREGDTTREAESESREGDEFQHDQG